jgi:hypothetical protein
LRTAAESRSSRSLYDMSSSEPLAQTKAEGRRSPRNAWTRWRRNCTRRRPRGMRRARRPREPAPGSTVEGHDVGGLGQRTEGVDEFSTARSYRRSPSLTLPRNRAVASEGSVPTSRAPLWPRRPPTASGASGVTCLSLGSGGAGFPARPTLGFGTRLSPVYTVVRPRTAARSFRWHWGESAKLRSRRYAPDQLRYSRTDCTGSRSSRCPTAGGAGEGPTAS